MAIGPVGAVAYANQAMPAQTKMQSNFQNRLDAQAGAATAIQDADKQEIEDIRPAEETYKIDPEHEHEKKKNDEEQQGNKEKPKKDDTEQQEKETAEIFTTRHLDIKV